MTYDVSALRKREYGWTASGELTHLNSASTGAMPQCAIDTAAEVMSRRSRPMLIPDAEIFRTLQRSRELIAELVHCAPDEIALSPNTSFGINLAANTLPLKAGDVVLTFEREFPANVYPWLSLAKKGVETRFIPCVDGFPDETQLLESISDPRVRCVAISWVSFASGYRVDLAAIGKECRTRGVFFAVDGIQGLGPAALDLESLHIDVFASGGQKWLVSPWGTGFTYVRRELIDRLEPLNVGWLAYSGSEDFNNLTSYNPQLRGDARRFEVGTLGLQDFAALNASLQLFQELGPAAIVDHVSALTQQLVDWADTQPAVELKSPRDAGKRAGIVSLGFTDSAAVAARLRSAGISFSLREGAIRLAPHFFNTCQDIEKVTHVMEGSSL